MGLPKLFAERILQKLRNEIGTEDIPFEEITYGQLFAFVKKEGLSLCSELKLQKTFVVLKK